MFAKFTNTDGMTVWINPIHVRCIVIRTGILGGKKGTEIMLSGDYLHGVRVLVNESPGQVAERLSPLLTSFAAASLTALDDESGRSEESPSTSHTPMHPDSHASL